MAIPYKAPGITVTEVTSPSIAPLIATDGLLCLVGLAQGYIQRTDQIVLADTTPVALPGVPPEATVQSVQAVRDAFFPGRSQTESGNYTVSTDGGVTGDYTVDLVNQTVARLDNGLIPENTTVFVTYRYVPTDYFEPIRLSSLGDVESRFGPSWDSTGSNISTMLSYAAAIAFENGAREIICQPLFARATPGDTTTARVQPVTTGTPTDPGGFAHISTWQDTMFVLRDNGEINLIVPILGQSNPGVSDAIQLSIFQVVQDHIRYMLDQQEYVMAVLGEDASTNANAATKQTLRTHADTLRNRYGGIIAEHLVLVSPAKFNRTTPNTGQIIYVGGQYAAAAIAGAIISRPLAFPMTRRPLSGFVGVSDYRSRSERDVDTSLGLMVVEPRRQNSIAEPLLVAPQSVQIHHSVTLDNTAIAKREVSVIRTKHNVVESIRDTLETQVIGQILVDEETPSVVAASVGGVLETLKTDGRIVNYGAVDARVLTTDPTAIEVRFSYRPAFPLNYVNVVFSLDLSTGVTEVEAA